MNKNISMFFKSRSFKRGALSTIMTIVVIAAIILANVVVSAVVEHNYWYIDMTRDNVFKLSDEGLALLDGVDSEINIIFCNEIDELQKNSLTKMVYNTALELSAKLDNVHIKNVNIYKNPSSVAKYKTTAASSITDTSVIIESGNEFRVVALEAFFVLNDDRVVWAYNGEFRIISAILQITASDNPAAYFTIGHGESIHDEGLINLFQDAGYEIKLADLTKEEISPDTRFVIISSPVYDFQGISADTVGKKSEIEKIDDFLDDFGCLIVMKNPGAEPTPVLDSFLKEWGIEFDGRIVKDYDNSLTTDGLAISAQYSMGENTGASLISHITKLPLPPKAIVKNATPIKMVYETNGQRTVSPVLLTSHTANVLGEDGAAIGQGQYNLMTLSRESRVVDGENQYSYVLAVGTSEFASSDYIGQKAYSNDNIMHAAMQQMGRERVPADLDFKPFDDTSLDITAAQATSWALSLMLILPIISIIACIVVLIRRKHA